MIRECQSWNFYSQPIGSQSRYFSTELQEEIYGTSINKQFSHPALTVILGRVVITLSMQKGKIKAQKVIGFALDHPVSRWLHWTSVSLHHHIKYA